MSQKYLQIRGAFQEEDAIRIVKKVCVALRILHCQAPALIHRDIKPGNVMMREDGTVKLFDFDTARYYKRKEERDTVLLGTREYASPEHFGYGQTDISSDIYSIGVMMYELLTGKIPVNHRAAYKGRLLPVLNRCIQANPRKRFQSVQELQEVLSSYEKPWGILFGNKKKLEVCIMGITVFFIPAGILRKKLKAGLDQASKK